MKLRSSHRGRILLDGAARIIAAPDMARTRRALQAGSMASDWQAVGNDLRRSMRRREPRILG